MNDQPAPTSAGNSDAFAALSADLNARINPERSRHFDRSQLEASRDALFEVSNALWPPTADERVSVVGSNGKGSTAWYLSALAETTKSTDTTAEEPGEAIAPRPVGLYTSPHLTNVLERIRLDREPVDARRALAGLHRLRSRLADYESFSYFEILTLLARELFQESACPTQIYEAGLGGRFDATRIARAQTVVLTRIDLEHTQILGATPQAILREKLGIVSSECERIFYGPQALLDDAEIESAIQRLAPHVSIHRFRPTGTFTDYLQENLAFARFVRSELNGGRPDGASDPPGGLAPDTIIPRAGPGAIAPPPGRLEMRTLRRKNSAQLTIYFDVAHNPASIARALGDIARRADFPGFRDCEVRMGVLKDRDPLECLAAALTAGCQSAVLLAGGDLAPAPLETPPFTGDFRLRTESLESSGTPTPPPSGIRAVIVLGSHRIYNYFVELTTGGEKTDRDSRPQS